MEILLGITNPHLHGLKSRKRGTYVSIFLVILGVITLLRDLFYVNRNANKKKGFFRSMIIH